MSGTEPPKKKLRPARKQVLPGQVDKKQEVQTGKEYSASRTHIRVTER